MKNMQEELDKFTRLIEFCNKYISDIVTNISSKKDTIIDLNRKMRMKEGLISNSSANDEDNCKIQHYITELESQIAKLENLKKIIRWTVIPQLEALGSPFKKENNYRLTSFYFTHKYNLRAIGLVNEYYMEGEYDKNALLEFFGKILNPTNINLIITPVNRIYNITYYFLLGILAALITATILIGIYTSFLFSAVLGGLTVVAGSMILLVLTEYLKEQKSLNISYDLITKSCSDNNLFADINDFHEFLTDFKEQKIIESENYIINLK